MDAVIDLFIIHERIEESDRMDSKQKIRQQLYQFRLI